ncbi:MAG: hypothetical protein HPY66_2953 [Firmicutes bacterium]|nr:hypothetical protein [Bacillota bacterium]
MLDDRGNGIVEYMIIVAVAAILAAGIIPGLKSAIENRAGITARQYNSCDTLTEIEDE